MKKLNWTAIIFSLVFILLLVIRIKALEVIDIFFYLLAIAAFVFMGVAPLFHKNRKSD